MRHTNFVISTAFISLAWIQFPTSAGREHRKLFDQFSFAVTFQSSPALQSPWGSLSKLGFTLQRSAQSSLFYSSTITETSCFKQCSQYKYVCVLSWKKILKKSVGVMDRVDLVKHDRALYMLGAGTSLRLFPIINPHNKSGPASLDYRSLLCYRGSGFRGCLHLLADGACKHSSTAYSAPISAPFTTFPFQNRSLWPVSCR